MAANQSLDLIEVNDDVISLRHAQAEARDLDGRGQKVAVVADDPEGDDRGGAERVGEEQLVEARRAAVQDAEAVAALVDAQERLDYAVRQLHVAEQPLEVERVEAYLSG